MSIEYQGEVLNNIIEYKKLGKERYTIGSRVKSREFLKWNRTGIRKIEE